MRRAGTTVGEPVALLTNGVGCHDQAVEGSLVAHRTHGTDISVVPSDLADIWPSGKDGMSLVPVHWPTGCTGVRLGGCQVAVQDPAGNVIATTGRNYLLKGALINSAPLSPLDAPTRVGWFMACGDGRSVIAK